MLNIIRIFVSDAKRLATNVVAVVVIMGLAVIPSLYAWFNIFSNWDPYAKSATGNLSVAVASSDEGTSINNVDLNIGGIVVDNLKANDSIHWVFTKTADDAIDGVKSGKYYAALVIDENFSEDMISFIGGDPTHPKISYYENEKKNAIAPKITSKVRTTVQQEVDKAFVSTLAQGILEVGQYAVTEDGETGLTSTALNKMNEMDGDLTTGISIIDSYIAMTDSVQSLMNASQTVTNELNTMMENGRNVTNSAETAANAANAVTDSASDMITASLSSVTNELKSLETSITTMINSVENAGSITSAEVTSLQTLATSMKSEFDTAMGSVTVQNETLKAQVKTTDDDFDKLIQDLGTLKTDSDKTTADAKEIGARIQKDLDACEKDIAKLSDTYTNVVRPNIKNTMTSVQNSLIEVEQLLNYSSSSVENVSAILGNYPKMMAMGKSNLQATRAELVDMQTKLEQLISDMNSLNSNEQYNMLLKLIKTDPDVISGFITSPVDLDTEAIYPVKTNGSATAPFYVVLSIWVGALILVAIMKTHVKTLPTATKLRSYQEFFGRYLVFFLIGQLQTLITVMGCLLYVRIQCLHPFLFWLACAATSFTFTLFLYALTFAFGAVGEAIAVVLMVIQVAGSGGTFPIEVLPKVYQLLYKYMPFEYSMNAVRECVAGMYKQDYWIYLSSLSYYVLASLVIGLLLSIPWKRLNNYVEKKKAKTDIMA